MGKFYVGNPLIAKNLINPLENHAFLVNKYCTVSGRGRNLQCGVRFSLGNFRFSVVYFGGLGPVCEFLAYNFAPVRDNAAQRDIFPLECLADNGRNRSGQEI